MAVAGWVYRLCDQAWRRTLAKKRKNKSQDVFNSFDPAVEGLARERLFSGKQLYDYVTHRLRQDIRDEAQACAILLRAQDLGEELGVKLVLRCFEKRLLRRNFH